MSKNITVIGTGYVGLVTATCLADHSNNIICVDKDANKIETLKNGNVTIYEPGLRGLFERNIKEGRLHFSTDTITSIQKSSIIFFALPTPMGKDYKADLSAIHSVCNQIKDHIQDYKVIVNKSTVPVGTGAEIKRLLNTGKGANFDIISNPEFLKEGTAIEDFQKPERIVIGYESENAKNIMMELFHPFVMQGNPIICMNIESAEITKYASNAFLATKISYMNELANFCEQVGGDIDMVRKGMSYDSRIGSKFLYAGLGYGGSCFPKDVKAFIQTFKRHHMCFNILNAVEYVNTKQKNIFFQKILNYFGGNISNKKIAVWGLAFKNNTDDVRESRSLEIIKLLVNQRAKVTAYDPEAIETCKLELGDIIQYSTDEYDCLKNADALVIATDWNIFKNPNWEIIANNMNKKVIFDGKNTYEKKTPQKYGFEYFSVGR